MSNAGGHSSNWVQKSLDNQTKWTIGFAMKQTVNWNIGNGSSPWGFLYFADSSLVQAAFGFDTGGYIRAFTTNGKSVNDAGLSITSVATASQSLNADAFNYLEFQVVVSATAGQLLARINGQQVLATAANLNTAPDGVAQINNFYLGRLFTGGGYSSADNAQVIDDFYATDGNGSVNNSFLGDVKVAALLPSGAGTSTQFAVTGAASNYAAVNENPPNDDTSYVSSGTVGQQDLYGYPALSGASGNIAGVQVNLWSRKDDAGTRTIEPLVTNSGRTSTAAGSQVNIGTSYQDWPVVMETNPANGNAAFTFAEIGGSSDEFGVQEVA